MDAEIKKFWVDALRSGKYAQDREYLKTDKGYCCLGVLAKVCEILNPDGTINSPSCPQWDYPMNTGFRDKETLPYEVSRELGLDKILGDCAITERLMEMNDAQNKSFAEIADWIEVNL